MPAGQDHLEGDLALERELAGAKDDAHAAAAEDAEQLVAGDRLDVVGLDGRAGNGAVGGAARTLIIGVGGPCGWIGIGGGLGKNCCDWIGIVGTCASV